jgi:hypothetical protein
MQACRAAAAKMMQISACMHIKEARKYARVNIQ